MKKSLFLLTAVVLFATLIGCKEDTKRMMPKDRSTGGSSEILVVTQNDEQWDGMIGDAIRDYFGQEQYGLPQPEPIFKLVHQNISNFSKIFMKTKNILIAEINPSLDKAVVETGDNLWAQPQRVMKIIAPSREAWVETFNSQKEAFMILYSKVERDRIMNVLRPGTDAAITSEIEKKFGFKMLVPEAFYIAINEPDFMWIRKELDKTGVGFFIYTIPYTDTTQFDANRIISTRDLFLQRYVPGSAEGSYMSTEKEMMPPAVTYTKNFVTNYAAQTRGMWNTVGDYMGGPFIAYTFVDPKTNKLVTVEGYVYAPNQKKRDLLLQMEAVLYSIKFKE